MASAASAVQKMDETAYEFKENDDALQSMDDIDDFERRLQQGLGPQRSRPAGKPPPARAPRPAGMKKPGSDYVRSAQQARAPRTEEQEDADEAVNAVSDLDAFERRVGGGDY